MENEKKENENKGVVAQVVRGELTPKTLGAIAAFILALLGAIGAAFVFIDDHYVDKEVYNAHVTSNAQDLQQMDEKTALLFQAMKDQNDQEFNRIYKAIKDGTALPLIVRRDILLARGDNLSSEEKAELAILETKLDELNIE